MYNILYREGNPFTISLGEILVAPERRKAIHKEVKKNPSLYCCDRIGKTKTYLIKGETMHPKLYMKILKAKHQAEEDRLKVKQKLDLFRLANKDVKITKVIAKQYKDYEKEINQYNGLIRSLKNRLRQG